MSIDHSGAPVARRAAKRSPILIWEKAIHELIFSWLSWLAVLLVGAYARRRRRRWSHLPPWWSRATWRPYSMGWQRYVALVYCVLLRYRTSMLWSIDTYQNNYLLTSITWPYCGLKFTAHRSQVFFWSWPLTKCWLFDWIAGSCLVNLLKTGQVCLGAG